ncbi:MAG: XisI protein [Caldilineaceae bacterium]
MDKVSHYREIISKIIKEYAGYKPSQGQIETEAIIDPQNDHYEVMHVGWDGVHRIHGSVIHIDIIDEKIWVQYDGTNRPVVDELLAAGVPAEAIVLGFHPENVRQYTGFAIN